MSRKLPSKFYKYRSLSGSSAWNTIKTIIDNNIYFSSPASFNDIFDCSPVLNCSSTDEEIKAEYIRLALQGTPTPHINQLKILAESIVGNPERDIRHPQARIKMQNTIQEVLAKMGVFCVSELKDDILMWAHYSDNHKGICLEFSTDDKIMQRAAKVQYSRDRPEIDQLNEDKKTSAMKALLIKSTHWEYEQEWRIFTGRAYVGPEPIENGTLTGIIFGAMTPQSDIDTIRKLVSMREKPVDLYNAVKSSSKFQIEIVKMQA